MADNIMGGIGQITGEVLETVKEVATDVKDSFGEAIEQGAQASSSSPLTPQQLQQKEMDRQKQIAYARGWLKNVADEQQKVRLQNEQKEKQRLQVQKQEERSSEMKKEEKKKVNPALANIGKTEIKGGVGG